MAAVAMDNRRNPDHDGAPDITALFLDAEGNSTEELARAERGEIVEHDEQRKPVQRTWFFFEQAEIKWLPVREAAFLLWVLGFLLGIWLVIGLAFNLI